MPSRTISYRLATEGKGQVKADFVEIGQAGEATAKRLTETYEAQAAAAERAADRAARTAAKIAAIAPQTALQMQIGDAAGSNLNYQSYAGGMSQWEGSARRSAQAIAELVREQEEMERSAMRIRAVLDPAWAAQERYNQAIARARELNAAKVLTDQELILEEQRLTRVLEEESMAVARGGQSIGQRRAGMQQLSFQMSDIAQGVAVGTAAQVIFAQQAGQTAQAITLLSGEGGKFAEFMTGWWGMAISAGVVVLATLVPKLLETKDAVAKNVEELKKHAAADEAAGKAATIFATTQEGVHDSLLKAEEARRKATEGLLSYGEAANIAAKNNLETIEGNLRAAESYLTLRRAQLQAAQGSSLAANGPGASMAQIPYQDDIAELERSIAKMREDKSRYDKEYQASRADLAGEAAKRMTDPVERIKRLYEGPGGLIEQAKNRAKAEGTVNTELTKQLFLLNQQEQARIKAAQDAQRESNRKPTYGRDIAEDNRADLLDAARRYSGLSERRDKGALEALFKQANFDIDPAMVKWCAAFVNAVLATQGLKGTGSLAARSFLGFGSSTDRPTAGDIVVSSHRGQDHVGFFEGFDSRGNVKLFSGNSSDRVGESIVNKNDVLGFRRAPTAAQAFADEAKAAERAEEESRKLLETIAGIEDSFDPAAAAARKLATQLDEIRKAEGDLLKGGGLISPSRGALAMLGAAHPDFLKLNTDFLKQGAARFDETVAQFTQESQAGWRAYEDAANEAGQVVIDNLNEAKRVGGQFIDDVLNPDNWRSWGSFGKMILRDLLREMEQLAIANPLKNLLLGEKNSTGGGILKALFSGLKAGAKAYVGGGSDPFPGFSDKIIGHNAAGTEYWGGGLTWVGEDGAELVNLPRGSRVMSSARSRQMMAGAGGGAVIHQNFDFSGAIVTEDLMRNAQAIARAEIANAAPQIAQDSAKLVFDTRARQYGRG